MCKRSIEIGMVKKGGRESKEEGEKQIWHGRKKRKMEGTMS